MVGEFGLNTCATLTQKKMASQNRKGGLKIGSLPRRCATSMETYATPIMMSFPKNMKRLFPANLRIRSSNTNQTRKMKTPVRQSFKIEIIATRPTHPTPANIKYKDDPETIQPDRVQTRINTPVSSTTARM